MAAKGRAPEIDRATVQIAKRCDFSKELAFTTALGAKATHCQIIFPLLLNLL